MINFQTHPNLSWVVEQYYNHGQWTHAIINIVTYRCVIYQIRILMFFFIAIDKLFDSFANVRIN